jgi:Putative MetA-pathway of phenol degradation
MKILLAAAAPLVAAPALAQERPLCADRPGLGTPPCVVEPGRVLVETGLVDWIKSDDGSERADTVLFGDTLARIGVSDRLELQLGWTPVGYLRVRDRAAGIVTRTTRVGDALLGAKLNLASPDGSGASAAVQAQVSLPVGRGPIGAGDWGVSVIVPVSYELANGMSLQASPEIDGAVDADGSGRHLAWGSTVGLGFGFTETLGAAIEGQVIRDQDPLGHSTQALVGVSFAWQRGANLQFDAGANAGLNRDSDDLEVYAGISYRF